MYDNVLNYIKGLVQQWLHINMRNILKNLKEFSSIGHILIRILKKHDFDKQDNKCSCIQDLQCQILSIPLFLAISLFH